MQLPTTIAAGVLALSTIAIHTSMPWCWTRVSTGQDPATTITVYLDTSPPVYWAFPHFEHVRLVAPDGSVLRPEPDDTHGIVRFGVSGEGPYTLTVDDPRFERVQLDGLRPTKEPVRAVLVGLSAIRIRALDGATGKAIGDWTASLRLENSSYPSRENPWDIQSIWTKAEIQGHHARAWTFELRAAGAQIPTDGVFRSIAPGDYTLVLGAPGYATAYVALPGLGAIEERALTVPLWTPGSIRGVVKVDSGLDKAFPVELFAFAPGEESARPVGFTFIDDVVPPRYRGYNLHRATCTAGEDGAFLLEGLAPGVYLVQARQTGPRWREDGTAEHVTYCSQASAVFLSPGETRVVELEWRER